MKPKRLLPGDTLSLVSPASPVTAEQVETGTAFLHELGYKTKVYASTFAAEGYLAGSDAARAADLTAAFTDPETQGVFCMRGGYGCSRLIPHLDFDLLAATGKLFSGFSDITVLHSALNRRGLPTLHAPMVLTLGTKREDWVYESVANALKGDDPIPDASPSGECAVPGRAEGVVAGGCMILMCDLIGTSEQLDLTDKIVLLEDVDEAPHRVDAMLTHLLLAGGIGKAAGIAVGEMTRTDEKPDKMIGARPWVEIVHERLAPLGIPMILNLPCGHAKNALSLPLGIRAELDADAGRLNYLESLCI